MKERRKSFGINQVKVGDYITIGRHYLGERFASFEVTDKRSKPDVNLELSKVPGEKYKFYYPEKQWWSASELSAHYAKVFRDGEYIGYIAKAGGKEE